MEWMDLRLFLMSLKSAGYFRDLGELMSAVETEMLKNLHKFPEGYRPEDVIEVLDTLGYLKIDDSGNWTVVM